MCGIVGIVNKSKKVDKQRLQTACDFLKERGPEAEGFYINDHIGFGHRRLCIIDLDARSNQPMQFDKGNLVITYNGEIYNFQEIKKELEGKVNFETTSDTEVILAGYLVWGIEKLLERIEGMFAFSLLDKKKQIVYLVRDRFGKKPLYYYNKNETIIFSSDIRSIWVLEKDKLSIDFQSLDYYLSELSVPQPKTIWKEVEQIKPAHYLRINLSDYSIKENNYWQLKIQKDWKHSIEETVEVIEQRLTQSILKRSIADVSIGCFLSGGVDSGLIVALLASNSRERIKTFTIGFEYDDFNELADAKLVAERYNTEHHEIRLKPDVISVLPELIDYYGEPFADSSMLPTFYVSKSIKDYVTVALSGDGGDELFGGYINYGYAYSTDKYQAKYPNKTIRETIIKSSKLLSRVSPKIRNLGSFENFANTTSHLKLFRNMGFSEIEKQELYTVQTKALTGNFTDEYLQMIWKESDKKDITNTLMFGSLKTRLLNDYLVKVDRASMKNSLEVRSPFLDYKLAELAFSIPKEFKFKDEEKKYLLKKLGQKYMYSDIFTKKKRGFGIPIKYWLKKELKDFAASLLFDGLSKRSYFNRQYIEKIFSEHVKGINDSTHKIWALMCLELWFQKFVDK